MRMTVKILGALALVAVGAWNVGAGTTAATNAGATTTGTATVPATTASAVQAVTADYSNPGAALRTFLTAAQQGDVATARAAMVIPPERKAEVDVFIDAMAATARLQAAARAKFGATGAARFGMPTAAELAEQLKRVEGGTPKVQGDTASLEVPRNSATGQASQTVQLKRVGTAWKVDGATYFHLTEDAGEQIADRVALTRRIAGIADEVAKDIEAGKYYSSTIAYQNYWSRCIQATKTPAESAATENVPVRSAGSAPAPASVPASGRGNAAGMDVK
jgi:hypothetical protein